MSGIENQAKFGPLLALRAAVDVVDERPRTVEAEALGDGR